jgi:transcriptional regulator with XRE-family HTH domain
VQRGWDVSPLLDDLLERRGWTQERLAEVTGIGRETVNGYATGRLRIGLKNAERIAAALGVTVLELGAPEAAAGEEGLTVLQRLEEAEAELARVGPVLTAIVDRLEALERRAGGAARRGGSARG